MSVDLRCEFDFVVTLCGNAIIGRLFAPHSPPFDPIAIRQPELFLHSR